MADGRFRKFYQKFFDNIDKNLDLKDILQINVTAIAGVLIFLTVGTLFAIPLLDTSPTDSNLGKQQSEVAIAINDFILSVQKYAVALLTATVISLFVASTIIALFDHKFLAVNFMIMAFIAIVLNLWYVTSINFTIASSNEARARSLNENLKTSLEARTEILDEIERARASNPDVQNQLIVGIRGIIEYCNAFPTDAPICTGIGAQMLQLYEGCKLTNNRDDYCIDPVFVAYVEERLMP